MSTCSHENFDCEAHIARLAANDDLLERDEVSAYRLTLTVACRDCGERFGFRSQHVGDLPDRPACSPDALELSVPLIPPSELELLGPLAAMQRGDGVPGYSVRVPRPPGEESS